MIAILEGKEIRTTEDFHKAISDQLGFPDFYGKNLDALWDCITGFIAIPAMVIWRDFKLSNLYLGDFAVMAKQIFEDAEKEIEGFKFECC